MLKDQIAIVTGGSRGIGKEIAVKLAEQGMKLTIVGSSSQISDTAEDLKKWVTQMYCLYRRMSQKKKI